MPRTRPHRSIRSVRAALVAQPLLVAALALLVVAGGFAARGGVSWYDAAHDESAAYATERDNALSAGEQSVQNLNTLDHNRLERGLDLWESSTTGELHSQLVSGRAKFEEQVKQAKVLSGAVTELDERAGRARVLIALRVTVRAPGSKATDKDSRMLGELTRTKGHWKLSALGQAPVGDTSAD